MRTDRLENMVRGWLVGDFTPVVHRTDQVEVAVRSYQAGENEERHYHKVAVELTVIVEGTVEMNGRRFGAGDIVVLDPGDDTDFRPVTDATIVVVKLPSARGDKYPGSMRGMQC